MERDSFLSMPPPRDVPPSVRKAAMPLKGHSVLVSITTMALAFGLLLSGIFFPTHLLRDRKIRQGPSRTVPGKILSAEDTILNINDVKVRKYRFSYQPDSGAGREGTAYTSGGSWREGMAIPVRYLESNPALAVPIGARSGASTAFGLLAMIFPLMAGGLLIHTLYQKRRGKRLLRYGRVGTAKVIAVENTHAIYSEDSEQFVFKIHLAFAEDGRAVVRSSHDPREIALVEERMDSSQPVRILYDPNQPKCLLFPETWNP